MNEFIFFIGPRISTSFKNSHSLKQKGPSAFTFDGIIIFFNESHTEKLPKPINPTDGGIMI